MNIKDLVESKIIKIQRSTSGYEISFTGTIHYAQLCKGLLTVCTRPYTVSTIDQFQKMLNYGHELLETLTWLYEQNDLEMEIDKILLSDNEVQELSYQILQGIKERVEYTTFDVISYSEMSSCSHSGLIYAFNGIKFIAFHEGECVLQYDQVTNDVTIDGKYMQFSSMLKGEQDTMKQEFFHKMDEVLTYGRKFSS